LPPLALTDRAGGLELTVHEVDQMMLRSLDAATGEVVGDLPVTPVRLLSRPRK